MIAAQCPTCDPQAGCQHFGCPCQLNGIAFMPSSFPEQLVFDECNKCPPVICKVDPDLWECEVERRCTYKEMETYVKDYFSQQLMGL